MTLPYEHMSIEESLSKMVALFEGKDPTDLPDTIVDRYSTTEALTRIYHILKGSGAVSPFAFPPGMENAREWRDEWVHDEDLRFPATGINPPGAATDPARNQNDGTLEFSASAVNLLAFQVQIPHQWVIGTNMHFHVHWQPGNTNTGDVYWQLTYQVANIAGTFPTEVVLPLMDAGSGNIASHLMTDTVEIDMTGITPSAMLKCVLARLGNDDLDTFTGVAKLLETDFHYTRYGHGYTFED